MFRGAFKKLEKDEAGELLSLINPHLDTAPFAADRASVMVFPLPFYPGYTFAEMTNHGALPPITAHVVYKGADVTVLNWTNVPIYALNKKVPVQLTDNNVADYARFFFAHVRGQQGRFLIIDTVDDIDWKEDPPASARKAIGKMLEELHITGRDTGGTWHLLGRMIFRDSLFQAHIHVTPDGQVSMSNEELLVDDMPIMDDTLGQ